VLGPVTVGRYGTATGRGIRLQGEAKPAKLHQELAVPLSFATPTRKRLSVRAQIPLLPRDPQPGEKKRRFKSRSTGAGEIPHQPAPAPQGSKRKQRNRELNKEMERREKTRSSTRLRAQKWNVSISPGGGVKRKVRRSRLRRVIEFPSDQVGRIEEKECRSKAQRSDRTGAWGS